MSTIERRSSPITSSIGRIRAIVPGLVLTASIAGVAFALRLLPGVGILSPLILSIFIGVLIHNVFGTPAFAKAGVTFSLKRVLRFAIILLGLQLTVTQLTEVGFVGLTIVIATMMATLAFTKWAGRMVGVDWKLAQLIAVGTSVCGASAVIAANTVTDASDEDVAYGIACVIVFGSIAMFVYPVFATLLHLSQQQFGLWAGSSIHEVAQVVAASYQGGQFAGELGTIAKLSRVIMLAPIVIVLGVFARRTMPSKDSRPVPPPWFVFGFIALIGLNSVIAIPPTVKGAVAQGTAFLLSLALAAMGLETDFAKLRLKGFRPLLLGGLAALFIAGCSLALIFAASLTLHWGQA